MNKFDKIFKDIKIIRKELEKYHNIISLEESKKLLENDIDNIDKLYTGIGIKYILPKEK